MGCIHNHLKLPYANNLEMVKCVKISMSNEDSYTIKVGDLVGIQFVKDDKQILVRRGRVKDLVVINVRELSNKEDNVSHIVLDCSQQFSVKIIDIKFKDLIKIGGIDDEFEDYSDRIQELEPNYIEGNKFPVREHGLVTKEEMMNKITKPDKEGVVKMNSNGTFSDLDNKNTDCKYKGVTSKGIPILR